MQNRPEGCTFCIMQHDHAAVPVSFGEVTSFYKGTKQINWLPSNNSKGSSASTFAILGHAQTTNYRLGDNWGLKFTNNQAYEG